MTIRLLLPPSVGHARARARAELLDQSLQADLAQAVTVDVADDYGDLERRARRGDADLAWLPPTIAARLEPELRGLFKCVREGRTRYRSAILVRRDGPRTLAGTKGLRAAWVDPLSVGGYLLAAQALRNAGVRVPEDLAESTFVGSYPEALGALIEGRAELTALTVHDDSRDSVELSLATYGGRTASAALFSLGVTGSSPNDAIGITRGLDARSADRLATRVFERRGARARAALCLALDAEGFVRAEPGEYAALRALLDA